MMLVKYPFRGQILSKILLFIFIGWIASLSQSFALPASGLTGKWLTIDDHSGKPRGIVQINENQGLWQGQLIKIYYLPGESNFVGHAAIASE